MGRFTMRHRHRHTAKRRGFLHLLAAHFAVLALAIQGFLVQPHIDAAMLHVASPSAAAATVLAQNPPEQTSLCLICQEALTAPGLDLATSPTVPVAPDMTMRVAAPARAAAPDRPASHHWRSRAPPTSA